MELADALRQACWSGLQDVSRFQLEHTIAADSRHGVPSWSIRNRCRSHPLAAPRRKHHLGIAPRDLCRIDNAVARKTRVAQLGIDRYRAGDLDELFHPPNPRDERVVPLFEKR